LPPLPYPYETLEPQIDTITMQLHHDKHHKAYVDNANKLLADQPELAKLSPEDLLKNLSKSRKLSALACATMWAGTSITPCFGR
jgi:superoxide dismutase